MGKHRLTARERFTRIFNREEVDRPFRYQLGYWPETLLHWQEPLSGRNPDELFQQDKIEYVPLISDFTTPYCPVFDIVFLSEDDETSIIIDKDGIKKKQIKRDIYLSMPQFLQFPVKDWDDYVEVRKRLQPDTESRIGMSLEDLNARYSRRDFPLGMYVCGGFAHPREMMGLENYLTSLFDQPDLIHEMMQDWLVLYKDLTSDIILNAKLDFIYIWEDMCYKGGPLLSPRKYEEFVCPYLKELIDHIKDLGINIIVLDSDGNMTQLIPWYIECGVNVLLPFEVQSGMDITVVRQQYPDLGILGGIDKKVLSAGKQAIETEVMSKVPILYQTGRYIASIDHSVPPDVPFENFKHYIELLRNLE